MLAVGPCIGRAGTGRIIMRLMEIDRPRVILRGAGDCRSEVGTELPPISFVKRSPKDSEALLKQGRTKARVKVRQAIAHHPYGRIL